MKKSPYPIWMHCWYWSVDVVGTIVFWRLAFEYDFFWVFTAFGIALPIWVGLETWSLINGVRDEREEQFQRFYSHPVTSKDAWIRVGTMLALFLGLNTWIFYLLGGIANAAPFFFYPLTNFILSTGPAMLWAERGAKGTREGNSVGLQILILAQVTVTWMPPGLGWWTSVSRYLVDRFRLAGVDWDCRS
ncbi:MAG: hypothetical protein QMB98_02885, partial [Flaviflexus sp.]|uniref:hypothetical protein n=1 Tax=Flaviflexus sp. TaxID=1969482 RepID=UPI00352D5F69